MKRNIVKAILPAVLVTVALAGCGKSGENTGTVTFEAIEDKENGNYSGTGADGGADGETSGQTKANEADEKSSQLYEDFLAGNAKAKFTGEADLGSYINLGNALTVGESYTLDEIIGNCEKGDEIEAFTFTGKQNSYIDCGQDGNKELLVELEYGAEFTLKMIVKDMGGELDIIYSRDQWSRSDLEINDDGTIESSGSGGATIHGFDQAYIDADGKYHFYYGSEDYGMPYSYYAVKDGEYVVLDFEGLDTDHFMITSYWTSDAENKDYYYTLVELDDNYEVVENADLYSESNPFRQKFDQAGIPVYTAEEVNRILDDRAAQIGYPIRK